MPKSQAVNALQEGIKADQHPVSASQSAMSDALNNTILTTKGNDLISQVLKSTSNIKNGYGVDMVNSFLTNIDIPGSGGGDPSPWVNIDVDETKGIYYVFYKQYRVDVLSKTFYVEIRVNYTDLSTEEFKIYPYQTLLNDEIVIPYDTSKIIDSIDWRGVDLDIFVYTNFADIGVYYLGDEAVVTPPHIKENDGSIVPNKILGVKTFNDIAYIVSGKESHNYIEATRSNNVSKTPYDDYIKVPSGYTEDDRDSLSANDVTIETSDAINGNFDIFQAYNGRRSTNNTLQNLDVKVLLGTISTEGKYTFRVTGKSQLTKHTNINEHFVRLELSYRGIGSSSFTNITGGYIINESDRVPLLLYDSGLVEFDLTSGILGTYPEGVELFITGEVKVRDRGRIGINTDATVQTIDKPFSITDTTLINISTSKVDAATNYRPTGSITIVNNNGGNLSIAIDYHAFQTVPDTQNIVFDNLPSGTYSIYAKDLTTGYTVKEIVTILPASFYPDLTLRAIITDYNTSVVSPSDNVSIRFILEDIGSPYTGNWDYSVKLPDGTTSSIATNTLIRTVIDDIALYKDADGEGLLGFIVEDTTGVGGYTGNEPTYEINGGGANVLDPDIVYEDTYKRKVLVNIPIILEELEDKKYYTEIGTFPSPDYSLDEGSLIPAYRPLNNYNNSLFITDKIHLSGNNYLDIEIQPSYDGTVNIIYTDNENLTRLVNSGFTALPSKRFEVIDRIGERDTNRYTSTNIEVTTRLIQSPAYQAKMNITSVQGTGGILEVGMYKYYMKLGTLDENETDFLEETGYVPIFIGNDMGSIRGGASGAQTEKSVEISLKNLDSSFAYVRLYVLINSGNESNTALAYRIDQKYTLPTPQTGRQTVDMTITHSGFEDRVQINVTELSEQKDVYKTIKTLTQIDNRLFLGNIGQNDIDYKKLFELGRKISVVPTNQNDRVRFNMLLEKWGIPVSSDDLRGYSQLYYDQKLDNLLLEDINKLTPASAANIFTIGFSQSHHNPQFVEKYSMYWPYETYPFRVCFIFNDDSVSYPIPVIGGDFSKYLVGVDTETVESEVFSGAQGEWDGSGFPGLFTTEDTDNWKENSDWKTIYNKLGVVRFPKQVYANAGFFPKFKFSLEDFRDIDPAILSKIKGFFFVRGERKPDLIMEGILGRCGLVTTSPIAFLDDQDVTKLTDPRLFPGDVLTAVPFGYGLGFNGGFTGNDAMIALEIIDAAATPPHVYGDPINATSAGSYFASYLDVQKYNHIFIKPIKQGTVASPGAFAPMYTKSGANYFKYWFRSGDIEADFPGSAALFNGSKFGMLHQSTVNGPISASFAGSFGIVREYFYKNDINVHIAVSGSDPKTTGVNPGTASNHKLWVLKPGSYKVVDHILRGGLADYVQGHNFARTGGAFASSIGFRSNFIADTSDILGILDTPDEFSTFQLTGNYPTYIGFTFKDEPITSFEKMEGLYSVYQSQNGPLTTDQLKTLYASDQGLAFTAITPKYLFEEFSGKSEIITDSAGSNTEVKENVVSIIGTRGDCYVNMNTFTIAKSLPAISGDPTTMHPHLADDSGEYNSYRASEASMTLQTPLRNNWLSYARHPEVIDEIEAALYNKARGFSPLYGAGDKFLGATRGNKLEETDAFNKGYRAHFEGRKYIGVSHDVPFIRSADENTIAFSEQYSNDSFFNGYRDFLGLNERQYKKEYGGITKIIEYGGNLVSVFQKGVALIGVNDQTVVGQNQSGNVLIDNANVMNPKAQPISTFIGSDWIRSILRTDNTVYGIDVENNKVWRLNGYNMEVISDNSVSSILYGFLDGFRGQKEVPGELYIYSAYDRKKKDVIFTFYNKNSRYTDIPLPMDPDVYYMLLDLGGDVARQAWVDDAIADPEENLRRHTLKERFDLITDEMDIHPSIQNHLTLVYNENTQTWVTRWNISPEFMFSLGSILYSINNEDLLTNLALGGGSTALDNYLDILGDGSGNYPYKLLFWQHETVSPEIPQWGSMYAQKPVYEVEFIINENSAVRKIIDNLLIEGVKSEPYEVIYQTSGEPQWLHHVLDTTDPTGSFATWADMQQGYTDRIINIGIKTVDPNAFIQQTINPRDRYSISKANYDYYNGLNKILVGKDIDYMYILPDIRQKYRLSNIQDSWVKIRLRYSNGKFTTIKAIYTLFRTLN